MGNLVSSCRQELGDQPPVTAPPRRLCAHETWRRLGQSRLEGALPGIGSHPRCVAAESGHPETRKALLAWLISKPAAELLRMAIRDVGRVQHFVERRLVELRIPPRAGEAADVDKRSDA